MASESRQPLRAVVRDGDAGHLLQRAVWFGGVPHQLRRIPIDLIQVFTIRRNPAVARAAADVSTKRPEGAIALDLGARRILRDSDLVCRLLLEKKKNTDCFGYHLRIRQDV